MTDFIAEILRYTPTLEYFVVGSEEVTRDNIRHECRAVPRADRQRQIRSKLRRWRRRVDQIIANARRAPTETTLGLLQSLPHDALVLAESADDAKVLMDKFGRQVAKGHGAGVFEQVISEQIAIIWLWCDK